MFLRSPVLAPRLLRGWTIVAIAALLAACGTPAPASSSGASADAVSTAATSPSDPAEPSTAAEPSAAASGSGAGEVCLPSDVLAAITDIADGNLEPEVALEEIADAVEALDVSELEGEVPFAVQDRDDLVKNLREAEPNPTQLEFAADVFRSELFELVGPCDSDGSGGSASDCLSADVVAALDDIDGGNLDTDPPVRDVAEALDGLDLTGAAADARDSLVGALREDPPIESMVVSAALRLRSEIALPEC